MNTSTNPARLRPFRPQPFGRYTLLSHLATGGMGEIYLARLEGAQGFEKLCVIKKILPQLAEDKEFVDRFVGEARTLVKLQHGSIAQVLDMGLHEGDAYMALEYVDGKDLRKVAGRVRDRQMPLPITFVLFVMGRVLDALAYAHRKRDDDEKEIHLVHRDISPQNILISYEGEVKVIDFGLAKSRLSAAKTNPSIILGKFLYMSPEQAKHQQVDRRSDLYAVGLCLYELISGKNPFDSVHPGELMTAVASPRIAPLSEVEPMTPPAVAQMVMKALAVEPAQRFQTAEDFRARLMSVLMEIDPSSGPESVSRFMRDLFAAEFQSERKLLAQLKDASRLGELPPRNELDTDPGARFPPPSLPPKTIKLDPPSQPLSFQPTPRSRPGVSVHDEETRPGVVLNESTRPAAAPEPPEAGRSRMRPALASTSPTADTVTVEIRTDPPERPPSPPVATPAPPPTRASAPTVEMPVPYVPPAAIPPGPIAPGTSAGTAKTLEAPRATVPPAPPASAPAPRPSEPPRAAVPPPPPPPAVASPRPGELPRVAPPPPPPASAPAPKAAEPQRMPPPPPASPLPPEPRSGEVARAQAPTLQNLPIETPVPTGPMTVPHTPMSQIPTPPAPLPAVREASAPPVPDSELPAASLAEPSGASRETARASRASEPSQALPLEGAPPRPDPSRRGLDDTHPSYLMASSKPPEDTQPRVVLEDPALRGEQDSEPLITIEGELEEPTPARAKASRRTRVSSAGMPAVSRGSSPGRAAARPIERESSEPEDFEPVNIEIEEGEELPPRDPRDDTRKTPLPTRPGGKSGRAQREEPKRATAAPAPGPARKRSWGWLVVSILMLVVAGGAVVLALPQLAPLLGLGQERNTKPPPAVPIRPVPLPSGPPGMTPAASPAPSTAPAAPAKGSEAAEPPAPEPGPAEAPSADDDMLVPLAPAPPAPPKKSAPSRPSKKGARAAKEANELQKEWTVVSGLYRRLHQELGCENRKLSLLCSKYDTLQEEVNALGEDGYSKDVYTRLKKLHKDFLSVQNSL